MSENQKKLTSRLLFRSRTKNKKTEAVDIVTQAENIVTNYIYKRKNEIINKYCKKQIGTGYAIGFMVLALMLCGAYIMFKN